MEAKCDGCDNYYEPSGLRVTAKGAFWCDDCFKNGRVPKPIHPILISYLFSWTEVTSLLSYLDGNRDLEILDNVDSLKLSLEYELFKVLRRALKEGDDETFQESDS